MALCNDGVMTGYVNTTSRREAPEIVGPEFDCESKGSKTVETLQRVFSPNDGRSTTPNEDLRKNSGIGSEQHPYTEFDLDQILEMSDVDCRKRN